MIQTTTLETSQTIYERLGWEYTVAQTCGSVHPTLDVHHPRGHGGGYDLAYLLDKLPKELEQKGPGSTPGLEMNIEDNGSQYSFYYRDYYYEPLDTYFKVESDTPTEAAGKLVLALADAGILTKGTKDA